MLLPEQIYLVRHGSYDPHADGHLTEAGKEQSKSAGEKLRAEGFDNTSRLLASTENRAAETAQIIAGVLDLDDEIVYSDKLAAMDHVDCTYGVIEAIEMISEETDIAIDPNHSLAVIGHGPMLYVELGVELNELQEGSVHKMKT